MESTIPNHAELTLPPDKAPTASRAELAPTGFAHMAVARMKSENRRHHALDCIRATNRAFRG
jgi:hypothetical protein